MGWQTNIFPLLIITSSGNFTGLFVYSTSPPSAGHLIASIAATGGTDPYGNAYHAGIDSYGSATTIFTQLTGGQIQFGDTGNVLPGQLSHAIRLLEMFPSASALTDLLPAMLMIGAAAGGSPQVLIGSFVASGSPPSASTNGVLEVQGTATQTAQELVVTAGGNQAIASRVTGDANDRHTVDGNGGHSWGSGAAATDCGLQRAAANKMNFSTCDVDIGTVGRGLQIKEGANARQGTAVLVAGSVVVANTTITSNTRIYVGQRTPGGTVGAPFVSSVTNGTGFTIKSTSATDTSTVAWLLVESG